MKYRFVRYTLLGNSLYKRGFSSPLQKCVNEDDAEYAVREVHEGICGNNNGGMTLAEKIFRQGN